MSKIDIREWATPTILEPASISVDDVDVADNNQETSSADDPSDISPDSTQASNIPSGIDPKLLLGLLGNQQQENPAMNTLLGMMSGEKPDMLTLLLPLLLQQKSKNEPKTLSLDDYTVI